jgi:hypothetical protein
MAFGIREALYARRAPLPNSGVSDAAGEHELLRGMAVNLLNPNAWLLLLTVMAPLLAFTWPRSPTSAVGFVVVFYLVLVSGKVAVAASLTMLRSHFRPPPIPGCTAARRTDPMRNRDRPRVARLAQAYRRLDGRLYQECTGSNPHSRSRNCWFRVSVECSLIRIAACTHVEVHRVTAMYNNLRRRPLWASFTTASAQ